MGLVARSKRGVGGNPPPLFLLFPVKFMAADAEAFAVRNAITIGDYLKAIV